MATKNHESVALLHQSGGLMSYGTDVTDRHRQVGIYADRILKGEKPAEMPLVQANKFRLVQNVQA